MPFWIPLGNSGLSIKIDAELPLSFACQFTLTWQRQQDNGSESETRTNCWLESAAHRGANNRHFCLSVTPVRTEIARTKTVCSLFQASILTPPLLRCDAICHAVSFTQHAYGCVSDIFTLQCLEKVCRHFILCTACLSGSLRCQQGLYFPLSWAAPQGERNVQAKRTFSWRLFSYETVHQVWLHRVETPKTAILQKSYFLT